MLKPGDWGHNKNCTLYLFNNVAGGGDADSPLRNPQQQGDVTLEINFGANPGQNLTVVVWREFESVMDISGTGVRGELRRLKFRTFCIKYNHLHYLCYSIINHCYNKERWN